MAVGHPERNPSRHPNQTEKTKIKALKHLI
jgi:hypothetical protein